MTRFAGLILGLLVIGLATWLALPIIWPSDKTTSKSQPPASLSAAPLQVPLTPQAQLYHQLEKKRAPFYRRLLTYSPTYIASYTVSADHRSLTIVLSENRVRLVRFLQQQLIVPYAALYGFQTIRYDALNPPGSLDRTHQMGEASYDDQTRQWRVVEF